MSRLVREGRSILDAMAQELERPVDARPTRAADDELRWIANRVRTLITALEAGRTPVGVYPGEIGRMVTDTWDLGTELGGRLLEFEARVFTAIGQ